MQGILPFAVPEAKLTQPFLPQAPNPPSHNPWSDLVPSLLKTIVGGAIEAKIRQNLEEKAAQGNMERAKELIQFKQPYEERMAQFQHGYDPTAMAARKELESYKTQQEILRDREQSKLRLKDFATQYGGTYNDETGQIAWEEPSYFFDEKIGRIVTRHGGGPNATFGFAEPAFDPSQVKEIPLSESGKFILVTPKGASAPYEKSYEMEIDKEGKLPTYDIPGVGTAVRTPNGWQVMKTKESFTDADALKDIGTTMFGQSALIARLKYLESRNAGKSTADSYSDALKAVSDSLKQAEEAKIPTKKSTGGGLLDSILPTPKQTPNQLPQYNRGDQLGDRKVVSVKNWPGQPGKGFQYTLDDGTVLYDSDLKALKGRK